MSFKIISVSQLNSYIKEKLDKDRLLRNIWIKGEISNFKHHSSGHMYFTLKDNQSTIKAVMFKSYSYNIPFKPGNGLSVLTRGNVSVYQRDGQYQLYVEEIHPEGYGVMSLAFEQLKKKLQDEGLFAPEKKKKIPILPRKIGIISSPTGAALRDILTVAVRRFPQIQIVIVPALVQGDQAPEQIVRAIKNISKIKDVDVIIVARGGGTLEELGAFNSEEVARAISTCQLPVVTGIGHETDFTIADFVADVRAATPSAAAEMVVPVKQDLLVLLSQLKHRLQQSPISYVNQQKQVVDTLERDLTAAMQKKVDTESSRFSMAVEKLNLLSPLAILARGYSICRDIPSHQVIASVAEVELGQLVEVLLKNEQKLICQVQEVEGGENESGGRE